MLGLYSAVSRYRPRLLKLVVVGGVLGGGGGEVGGGSPVAKAVAGEDEVQRVEAAEDGRRHPGQHLLHGGAGGQVAEVGEAVEGGVDRTHEGGSTGELRLDVGGEDDGGGRRLWRLQTLLHGFLLLITLRVRTVLLLLIILIVAAVVVVTLIAVIDVRNATKEIIEALLILHLDIDVSLVHSSNEAQVFEQGPGFSQRDDDLATSSSRHRPRVANVLLWAKSAELLVGGQVASVRQHLSCSVEKASGAQIGPPTVELHRQAALQPTLAQTVSRVEVVAVEGESEAMVKVVGGGEALAREGPSRKVWHQNWALAASGLATGVQAERGDALGDQLAKARALDGAIVIFFFIDGKEVVEAAADQCDAI
ncbi:hypothetical protein TYRP_005276 [Tyrophagus putrescentiae]|nr:hypothetical protein TYRP_005276 [Tyrophagus putrescentiae]